MVCRETMQRQKVQSAEVSDSIGMLESNPVKDREGMVASFIQKKIAPTRAQRVEAEGRNSKSCFFAGESM